MNRWAWTVWYKANTLRALLIALVAWILHISGVAGDAESQDAATIVVDAVLRASEGIAIVWAMYARAKQPTPPLTLTQQGANDRNAAEHASQSQGAKE
jgi:hypothetical protein